MTDATPLPPGRHAWLWKLGEVRDWDETFARARRLGFAGLHLHSRGGVLAEVLTRDLVRRANDAGLFLGASMACDTGTVTRNAAGKEVAFVGTPWEKFADAALRCADLLGEGGAFCFNWETRWERRPTHPDRRADAAQIAAKLRRARPEYRWWDAPWWWPGMHPSAPTDEFGAAMAFRVPQTYFVAHSKTRGDYVIGVPKAWRTAHPTAATPPEYMVGTARAEYARRTVQRPLAWGFQATAQAGADRYVGLCLREYPVTVWWHFLRLFEPANAPARRLFEAAAVLDARHAALPTFAERVRAAQAEHGLSVDGWLGAATADAVLGTGP